MFEGMDSVLNIYSVPSNISYKSLKIDAKFLDCDHRLNFDSLIVHVNQTSQSRLHQHCIISLSYTVFIFLSIFVVGISKSLISLSREDLPHRAICKTRTRDPDPGPEDPCKTRTLVKFYGGSGKLDI